MNTQELIEYLKNRIEDCSDYSGCDNGDHVNQQSGKVEAFKEILEFILESEKKN